MDASRAAREARSNRLTKVHRFVMQSTSRFAFGVAVGGKIFVARARDARRRVPSFDSFLSANDRFACANEDARCIFRRDLAYHVGEGGLFDDAARRELQTTMNRSPF